MIHQPQTMQQTIIEADEVRLFPDVKEIWKYRQLIYSLAWRDIRVKYAQTYVGLLWAFINPILNLAVLGFVFGRIAKVDTGGAPHLLFTAIGLVSWTYFSTLLSEAGNSIVSAQAMIKKIYFPRLVIPISKAISGLVDFVIVIICLIFLMIYYQVLPGVEIVFMPLFLLLTVLVGITGGIIISALTTRFRDFFFIVPFIVRLGMFLSPIAYSSENVPEALKPFYFLNPLAGLIEGFRWSLLVGAPPASYMFYSIAVVVLMFIAGLWYFTKIERVMADIL